MTISSISVSEFKSIVDKYKINEVSIDAHILSKIDIEFPVIDIGIKTYCEPNQRKLIIQRYKNLTETPIDREITIKYNPVISIYRDCLFVKPDDINHKRLESILDDLANIRFYFLDVSHPSSVVSLFKDTELQETIIPYSEPVMNYDVVIVFLADGVRNHLRQIRDAYQKPFSGIKESYNNNNEKRRIVDKYISSFSYKHLVLIVILAVAIISFSIAFGVDDMDPDSPRNLSPLMEPVRKEFPLVSSVTIDI